MYENIEDNDVNEYGDYTTPWKLDCAATNNFVGKQTGILRRKKVKKGFEVMVAKMEKKSNNRKKALYHVMSQQQQPMRPYSKTSLMRS